jgi:tRNA(Ile)-lysidine synthase
LAQWAGENSLSGVALGHTADDVAETFLIRLGRRAGVDGLARMREVFTRDQTTFLRPMLGLRRATLRAYLTRSALQWIEDPSNSDSRFERVRMREALQYLGQFDLSVEKISQSAAHLKSASDALRYYAAQEVEKIVTFDGADVILAHEHLVLLPQEIQRRLLIAALAQVAPLEFSPRAKAIDNLLPLLEHTGAATLSGCKLSLKNKGLRVSREPNAIVVDRECSGRLNAMWDNRWHVEATLEQPHSLRALGEVGLQQCPEWRETGRARLMLISSPSLWCGEDLIAAPLANLGSLLHAAPLRGREELRSFILSH